MKITKGLYQFTNDEIINALKKSGKLPKHVKAQAFMSVPGGGDWSNEDLEVDCNHMLKVSFKNEN